MKSKTLISAPNFVHHTVDTSLNQLVSRSSGFVASLFQTTETKLSTQILKHFKVLYKDTKGLITELSAIDVSEVMNIEDAEKYLKVLRYCYTTINDIPYPTTPTFLSTEVRNEMTAVKQNIRKIISTLDSLVRSLEKRIELLHLANDKTLAEIWGGSSNDVWDEYYKSDEWRK